MNRKHLLEEQGQTLVTVALMLVVLLLFLALAIDIGHIYAERRFMQNAADAGALEGARNICFVDEDDTAGAVNAAETVALNAVPDTYRTYTASASRQDWTITVTTTEQANTYIAGIIGIDTVNVPATAKAICGSSERDVGNIWPVTMNVADWNTVQCEEIFTVWRARPNTAINCTRCNCNRVIAAGNNVTQIYFPTQALYDELTTIGAPMHIGPGQDGWLNLPDPSAPMPLPTCNYTNCGAQGVACYISQPHPGPISVCDQIGNKSGSEFDANAKSAVRDHADHETQLSIPLWSEDEAFLNSCQTVTPVMGNCGTSSPYTVADFGCLEILGYSTKAYVPYLSATPGACEGNLAVIFARKICDGCNSYQGGTGGGDPQGNGPRSISLWQ